MSLRAFGKQSPLVGGDCFVHLVSTFTSRPACARNDENILMPSFPYNRIVLIGVTSSGKSTLAEQLAKQFNLNYIELDALHWEPNWQEAPLEVFRARVEIAMQAGKWIVAGNNSIVRDLVLPKAEAVIWLDYSLLTVLWQLTRRTFTRWWTQELLWGSIR